MPSMVRHTFHLGLLVLSLSLSAVACTRLGFRMGATPRDGGAGEARVDGAPMDGALTDSTAHDRTAADRSGLDHASVPAGALPVITALTVVNAGTGVNAGTTSFSAGDPVKISFTVEDTEGLASGPMDLEVTTDGTAYTSVVRGFGSTTGNPKSWSGSYDQLKAPSSGFFRIRAMAWDAAGQSSIPVLSEILNGGAWSVYAGSSDRGVGGSGRAALLNLPETTFFVVSPKTGDLFALDYEHGVIKLDAATGLTSRLIEDGATNLPDDGSLPARPALSQIESLAMDSAGRLYVKARYGGWLPAIMYQLDLQAGRVRRYLGGGTVFDGSATPSTVALRVGPFAFDEENSVYFHADCTPQAWTKTSTIRLMKATQKPDGSAGTLSVVAGNCVRGAPPTPGPGDALSSPVTDEDWPAYMGSIAVWNKGEAIYYGIIEGRVQKIVSGKSYATDIALPHEGVLAYDPTSKRLWAANGVVRQYEPQLTGPGGEVQTQVLGTAAVTPGCNADGVPVSSACLLARVGIAVGQAGSVLFVDGPRANSLGAYRIRGVDSAGRVQTRLGRFSFVGDGLDRRVVMSAAAGIAFKSKAAPNPSAWPEGLYVMDRGGPVLWHIDPRGKSSSIWGSQRGSTEVYPDGTPVSPDLSLGETYTGGSGWPLSFDQNGLPWLRYNHVLARLDSARKIVAVQDGSMEWVEAPEGADPASYTVYPFGSRTNLALSPDGVFLVEGYLSASSTASIRYYDFTNHQVTHLMGKSPNGVSADSTIPGAPRNLGLSSRCLDHDSGHSACYLVYSAKEDRLYFSEEHRLRYLTSPTTPSSATLQTLFTQPSSMHILSFVFSPDGKQVFYVSDGRLRCHDLGSGDNWCNDAPLGPPDALPRLERLPNQLAFDDAGHLFISSGQGEIYAYTLPQ